MTFPTPYTVTVHDRIATGALDAHRNPVYADEDRSEPVMGWGPAGSSDSFDSGREAVSWDLDLLVPATFSAHSSAEVTVDGDRYTIVGGPQDYSHGPFGTDFGNVVHLTRTQEGAA